MTLRIAAFLLGSAVLSAAASAATTTVTYNYDTLGRLSTVCYQGGYEIIYSYDPAGNRTSVVVQTVGACS